MRKRCLSHRGHFKFVVFYLFIHLHVYAHLHTGHDTWELVLSFHLGCSRDQTQVKRLDSKCFYLPSYLAIPIKGWLLNIYNLTSTGQTVRDPTKNSNTSASCTHLVGKLAGGTDINARVINMSMITNCIKVWLISKREKNHLEIRFNYIAKCNYQCQQKAQLGEGKPAGDDNSGSWRGG